MSLANRDDPCHENLSWAAKRDFNQLQNAFTSKLNQFFIVNLFYASFKATVRS